MKSTQQKYDEAIARAMVSLETPATFNTRAKNIACDRRFKTAEEAKKAVAHHLGMRAKVVEYPGEPGSAPTTSTTIEGWNSLCDSLTTAVMQIASRNKPKEAPAEEPSADAAAIKDKAAEAPEATGGAKKAGKKGAKAGVKDGHKEKVLSAA